VDKEFWERVIKLVKQIIPKWNCPEIHCTIVLAMLLIVRTMMSIWLADVNGRVVKAIVNKDLNMFLKRVSFHPTSPISTDFYSLLVCSSLFDGQLCD